MNSSKNATLGTRIALGGLVLVLCVTFFFAVSYFLTNQGAGTNSYEDQAAVPRTADLKGEGGGKSLAESGAYAPKDSVVPRQIHSSTSVLFGGARRSRDGFPLGEDRFGAESEEEQRWLDRNGFPTNDEWDALASAPTDVLANAAREGDPDAALFLSSRRQLRGDDAAEREILRQAAGCSIFALHLYAAGLVREDPEMAYAVLRVAEMHGDTRVTREGIFPTPLTYEQLASGEELAVLFYRRLEEVRRQENLSVAGRPPRTWPCRDRRPWP